MVRKGARRRRQNRQGAVVNNRAKQWVVVKMIPCHDDATDKFDILDGFYTEPVARQLAADMQRTAVHYHDSTTYFADKYDSLQPYSFEIGQRS